LTKFGTVMQFDPFERSDRLKFEFFKIQDGSIGHLEKPKNRDTSATVGAISTKFGTVTLFNLLDRSDRYKF